MHLHVLVGVAATEHLPHTHTHFYVSIVQYKQADTHNYLPHNREGTPSSLSGSRKICMVTPYPRHLQVQAEPDPGVDSLSEASGRTSPHHSAGNKLVHVSTPSTQFYLFFNYAYIIICLFKFR